ncbi:putative ankyrin repeat-containing domain, PGG domain, ankyrin repeat-containing domain superfamily [Helianthus debilis subsp. tardiflorus]
MANTMKHEQTIDIPDASMASRSDLLGNREDYLNLAVPLYQASLSGDWETAKIIFDERRDLVQYDLMENLGTALHVAATSEETKQTLNFVKNLVNMMTREELELKNKLGNTAFYVACVFGNTKVAKIMMEKNNVLSNIRGSHEYLPLSASALAGKYSSVKYLYYHSQKMTGNHWTDDDLKFTLRALCREWLLCFTSLKDCHISSIDIAFQIVADHPELDLDVKTFLRILARKPEGFDRVEKSLSTRIIESTFGLFCMKVDESAAEEDTYALKLLETIWGHATRTMNLDDIELMLTESRILFVAARAGNTRFIVELLRTYPNLMLRKDAEGRTIFHIAVMYRHLGIYNLLYEAGDSRNEICISEDKYDNNMLHLVARWPESSSRFMAAKRSEASLLMQRQVLWFKEVYDMLPPYLREAKNKRDETPFETFSLSNERQVSSGLQWMKDCMVVATLIITVAFAVAFTVPGGYNQDHGLPLFIHRRDFLVFVIADAISLFSSSTSLLVFLSILTSGYEQLDFLFSLPRKLLAGLLSLFISVAAMMVTFSASFFVMYHQGLKWVPILIAAFATIPVGVFAIMQFHILVDMFRSLYDPRYLFNPKKRMLYPIKQRLRSNNSPCWRFQYKSIIKSIFAKRR